MNVEINKDDICPKAADTKHVPDWDSVEVNSDGGMVYIDINCSLCGRSGCLGTSKSLTDSITW